MAAPPEITCKNLSGRFVLNKGLSDNPEGLFILQGLSWFTRRAISLATVLITIKEYQDDGSTFHIDITSVASGLSTTQEDRTLDWQDRDHNDKIFGSVKGKSRLFNKGEFEMVGGGPEEEAVFLKGEQLKNGGPSNFIEEVSVQSWAANQDKGYGWTAEQVWNFEEVDGKRRYTRRVVGRKGDKSEKVRLVYDYKGPTEDKAEDDGLAYGEE